MSTVSVPPSSAGTVSSVPPRKRPPILPPETHNPLWLLLTWVVPQFFLLVMNLRSFGMIWGEMSEAQRMTGRWLLGSEISMLVGICVLISALRRLGKSVGWTLNWPLFVVAVSYLWFVLIAGESMIPASVSMWILPPESFLYYQFAFVMPAAFFAAVQLVCVESDRSPGEDISISLAMLVGIPLGVAFCISLFTSLQLSRYFSGSIVVLFLLFGTIIAVGALLRLVVVIYRDTLRAGPKALAIFSGVIALAAPIGGLLLNQGIPFPADFQSAGVYVMAALNGLILLLPNFRDPKLHRAVWLAQCALFPFTFYFFVVFLPFLPLSLFAMIIMGSGFLILAPTALFLLHGQRILDGFRHEIRLHGRLIPALLGTAAIVAGPLVYTVRALRDRSVLNHAIEHVYSADYRASGFRGNPDAIGRTLVGLRDFKAGIQLPFISDYYNWLVFDGLVLPDEKMAHLHRVFLGRDLPEPSRRMGESFFSGGRSGRNRNTFSEIRRDRLAPPKDVQLEKLVHVTEPEDALTERTRVTLTLKSTTSQQSEFATALQIPEGVLVSGFWLHIGTERVPGRIFEKKTAMWVYQKIRDVTRRDPGILIYTGPETLELRVYPFAAYETRTVEIEFLRPSAMSGSLKIGEEVIDVGDKDAASQIAAMKTGENSAAIAIPQGALAGLPSVSRWPYLHFIVDRSAGSTLDGAKLRDTLVRLAQQFPLAKECVITAANFDATELTDGFLPISALGSWDVNRLNRLPKQGGFAQDRALKRVMLLGSDDLRTATPNALQRFPVPIIVRGSSSQPITEGELEEFGELAPDLGGYFVSVDGGELVPQGWNANDSTVVASKSPRPVTLFKAGNAVAPVLADQRSSALIPLTGGNGELQVWDSAASSWKSAAHIALPSDGRYARGAGAWAEQVALVQQPFLGKEALRRLVTLSRETGVIVPATSYIVVENSAQWRKLEETEKKKLASNAALELQETPEPTTALLLACGGAILASRRMRRREEQI